MAHWHGLAKLRMHSDLTLSIMDEVTSSIGQLFREFKATVCSAYNTRELRQEILARTRRQAAQAAKRKGVQKGKGTVPLIPEGNLAGSENTSKNVQRIKVFNFQTYKFHALGDYVSTIRQYGTCDSYSTEPVRSLLYQLLTD
jgi:DNA invertase Pin-like site-specific DNA recombinase